MSRQLTSVADGIFKRPVGAVAEQFPRQTATRHGRLPHELDIMLGKMTRPVAVPIGPHHLWTEDDLLVIVLQGTLEADQSRAINQFSLDLIQKHGYSLILVDAHAASHVTAETRRVAAAFRREHPVPTASAIVGLNVVIRSLATLVYRGLALVDKAPQLMEMFKSEAEALAWLAAQRPRLRAQVTRTSTP
jgi:hypothetical protein